VKDTEKIMILIEDTQRRDETDKNVFLRVSHATHLCNSHPVSPNPTTFYVFGIIQFILLFAIRTHTHTHVCWL